MVTLACTVACNNNGMQDESRRVTTTVSINNAVETIVGGLNTPAVVLIGDATPTFRYLLTTWTSPFRATRIPTRFLVL